MKVDEALIELVARPDLQKEPFGGRIERPEGHKLGPRNDSREALWWWMSPSALHDTS